MTTLLIKNLRQRYTAGAVGVHNFNIQCENGEKLCVLAGEQGGKTSLIRCIAGLLTRESGQIILNGEEIQDKKIKERDIALIFQDCGLIKGKSVKWNLAYPLKLRKVSKEKLIEEVNKAAEKFNIAYLLTYPVSRLKDRDRIRLAFARASLRDASLLLIDNPFASLKGADRREMFLEMLPFIKNYGGVVIFATDSADEAFTLGDKISILHYGVAEQTGSKAELKENPASLQVYKYAHGIEVNIVSALLGDENGIPYIDLLGNKILLDKRPLLNNVYIGAAVTAAFLAEQASFGTESEVLFCEEYCGNTFAHTNFDGQTIIVPAKDIGKRAIDIRVIPESIRLYDSANEKLIY